MDLNPKFLTILMLVLCLNTFAQDPPNIIFILTDDQGWNDLSIESHEDIASSKSDYHLTPNMDSLVSRGMRFSNAYSPHALCQPSRHSIMFGISATSLNHVENGFYDSTRSKSALSMVKTIKKIEPSYKAGAFGKWHMPSSNLYDQGPLGFDVWHTGNPDNGSVKPRSQDADGDLPANEEYKLSDGTVIVNENGDPKYINTITEQAISFMTNQANNNTPFFCYIAHWAPHYPYVTTQARYDEFKNKTKGDIHNDIGRAAMMKDLDNGIGQVLDMVKELGIDDNTYIIFTSDNGSGVRNWPNGFGKEPNWGDPEPLYGGKGTLFQGGIRVPFAISGPGITPDTWNSTPIIGYDIYPTVCDLIGGESSYIPNVVEGASIKNHALNGSTAKLIRKREVDGFPFVYHKPGDPDIWSKSAFVQGDYKILLQHEFNPDRFSLFNTKNDIGERTNLASSNPDKFANLLRQWYNHVVDKEVNLPDGALTEASTHLDTHYNRDIPATVQAEDYRSGYGMVVDNTSDASGDEFLVYMDTNDYMDYRINAEAGDYEVTFRVAAKTNNIKLQLLKEDGNVIGIIDEEDTGSFLTWKDTEKITVSLIEGNQVLRVKATGSGWNFNSMKFNKVGNNNPIATEIRLENVQGVNWLKDHLNTVICAPTKNTGENTKWVKTPDGDYFSLKNQGSGKYLGVSGNDVILTNTYNDKAKWKFTATSTNWFVDNKWCLDNNQNNTRLKFLSDDVFLVATANSGDFVQWTEILLDQALSNSVISKETNNSGFDVKTYPNPSDGNITVSFDQRIQHGTWEIVNNLGQLVSKGTITNKKAMEISIHQELGLYFLSIVSKYGKNTMPILIAK